MVPTKKSEGCCGPGFFGGAKIEALVSVDERGQMVLPKEIREKADIKAGEKFALMSFEQEGKLCCMVLIKAEELVGMAKSLLGPVFSEIIKEAK